MQSLSSPGFWMVLTMIMFLLLTSDGGILSTAAVHNCIQRNIEHGVNEQTSPVRRFYAKHQWATLLTICVVSALLGVPACAMVSNLILNNDIAGLLIYNILPNTK